jgi:hypothetical protein
MRFGPLVGLFAIAVTGCGASDSRTAVPSCGTEENNPNAEGRHCLLQAFEAGTPASFVSQLTSIEGDPITRTYLVDGSGSVLIAHDARQDKFGSGTIEYLRCRLVPVADWNRTQVFPDLMPAEVVFVEDACVEVAT